MTVQQVMQRAQRATPGAIKAGQHMERTRKIQEGTRWIIGVYIISHDNPSPYNRH